MKLMVVDGNSIVNRAFYGIRMLNAPDGTPTNAVYGFLTILQHMLSEETPDGLCVAFDLKAPTFRHLKYDAYKAQRKGMPDELALQIPVLKHVLDAMNIPRYELEGWEADDLIGTISRKCEAQGWECCIVTGDKDSFQLATDKIYVKHVKTRMGKTETKRYDRDSFRQEYGFEPEGMVDLKALMGDTSDNIPGVAGVGEKTAMDLIGRFGSINAIYDNLDTIDIRDSVRKKLAAGREMAYMSYDLATIICTAPIEFDIEKTRLTPPDNDALYAVFKKLGFAKMIDKYGLTPPTENVQEQNTDVNFQTVFIDDADAAENAVEELKNAQYAGFFCDPQLDTAALAYADKCVVFRRGQTPDYDVYLGKIMSGAVKKAGYNVKDIMRTCFEKDIEFDGFVFDGALASYLLSSTDSSYDIDRISIKYLGISPDMGDEAGQMSLLPENDPALSIASQAQCAAMLYGRLDSELRKTGMEKLMYEIELPLCRVLADMEFCGFLVDRKALTQFGQMLSENIALLEKDIYDMAGQEFNINSPKQLGAVLFEKLMLPAPKKTKTGYSTSADVLEKLIGKHPIIQSILDYRQLAKLKSTYADGLVKVIAPDGRIHTKFQMTVTATGRLSSTEPNLQNIPVRTELGGEIRKMFVAGAGNVLVDADYSQIELRLLAHISGDKVMLKGFADGEDVHRVTASQVFDTPINEVTGLQRSRAKAVNFGIVYGIGAFSLAQDIHVSVAEAKQYMDSYLEKYSGVREHMKQAVDKAKEDGFAVTEYGRRRYLPELKSSNHNLRAFGERVALNMPIQGTAADIMKIAMINVYRRIKEEKLQAKLILQVHDELIVECPESEREAVINLLVQEMSGAAELSVPLTVDAHGGGTWYEAK